MCVKDWKQTIISRTKSCLLMKQSLTLQEKQTQLPSFGPQVPNNHPENEHDSPKVNVWCTLMKDKVTAQLFFLELNITSNVVLDMLENYILPQTDNDPDLIFQLGSVPPHFCHTVCESLDRNFLGKWTGRQGPSWAPRSPDLTPLDF
jgi:hypothetical protein